VLVEEINTIRSRRSLYLLVINVFTMDLRLLLAFLAIAVHGGGLIVPQLFRSSTDFEEERSDFIQYVGSNTYDEQNF